MDDGNKVVIRGRAARLRAQIGEAVSAAYDLSLALLYPQACAACGAAADERRCAPVCGGCLRESELFSIDDKLCWKCGAPGAGASGGRSAEQLRCRACDAEPWTAARSAGRYEGALRACVLELKRRPHIGGAVVGLMSCWQRAAPLDRTTTVVPVPLHARRERERGFNQARVLAEQIARRAALPLDDASLVRTKYTEAHRAGMDAEGRRESVEEAFEVKRPRMVRGESVLLVDDVWTTGATAAACVRPLLDAGARDVYVLTLARAGMI